MVSSCLIAATVLLTVPAPARAADAADRGLSDLSAADFLQEIRRPFRQDAWGEATGTVHYVSEKDGERRGTLRVRMTFSPESLHAQLVLNEVNVYGFQQRHNGLVPVKTEVDLPENETPPGLFDFGIKPEDLTFAFIYWDLREEREQETFRGRTCRVMELAHPAGKGSVRVWFSAAHGFPMKAEWYRPEAESPWRMLELKGAKKHDNDLWFVKEMRLDGDGWKTKVRFDHAEISPIEERAAPAPEE